MRGREDGSGRERMQRHDWWGVVLDAPDARELGRFYEALLGWKLDDHDPGFVTLDPGEGVAYLACQTSAGYQRPVWPNEPGRPQLQLHLDLEVGDLAEAVAAAIELGAGQAAYQPQKDVRVMLDPAGHPFCLYAAKDG